MIPNQLIGTTTTAIVAAMLTVVARIEAASGSLDTAESYLWAADRVRTSTLSMTVATADIHRQFGDPLVAANQFIQPNARRQKQLNYAIARNRALLAAGLYGEVLDIFHVRIWFLGDELWHPDLLGTVGEALALDSPPPASAGHCVRSVAESSSHCPFDSRTRRVPWRRGAGARGVPTSTPRAPRCIPIWSAPAFLRLASRL